MINIVLIMIISIIFTIIIFIIHGRYHLNDFVDIFKTNIIIIVIIIYHQPYHYRCHTCHCQGPVSSTQFTKGGSAARIRTEAGRD